MEFAVTVDGKTLWVLAVEGDRVLTSPDGEKLKWVDMADCKFAGLAPPDQPRPVFVLQPQKQGPKLVRAAGSLPGRIRGNHGRG